MVKRILIVLVVLGLAWMAVSWMIGEKRRNDVYERRQAEYRAREESEIEEFLSKYEVVPDWEEQLCAGREIFDELMTADIERVWIGGRPIVYKGGIKDIAMHDERHYEVQLRMAPFSMMPGIMLHRLGLRVIADKQIIDRQLEKHPGITGSLGIFYTLYTIVSIDSVVVEQDVIDGEVYEVRVGMGNLIDLLVVSGVSGL